MRIFTEKSLNEYCAQRPECKVALQDWALKVKKAQWKDYADVKSTFRTVDYIGNQRYVFNIKGNDFRLVAIVRFTIEFVYIRFIGTHAEYEKIKDIKNI